MPRRCAWARAARVNSWASETASGISSPLASMAQMAADKVVPAPVNDPGRRCQLSRRMMPVSSNSALTTSCISPGMPVTKRYSQPISTMRVASSCRASPGTGSRQAVEFYCRSQKQCGLRDQQLTDGDQIIVVIAILRRHGSNERIQNQRDIRVIRDNLGNRGNILNAADRADLECGYRHVFKNDPCLIGHPVDVDDLNVFDTRRIADQQGRDDGQAVAAHGGKGSEVGLDAGCPDRVGCAKS